MTDKREIIETIARLREGAARMRRELGRSGVIAALARACARWRDSAFPFRREAEARLAETGGFSPPMVRALLDATLGAMTEGAFAEVLAEGLGGEKDEAFARAPEFTLHVLAGNVPAVSLVAPALGLLAGGASLVKPPTEAPELARLFAGSLAEIEPALGGAIAVAEWAGGSPEAREIEALALDAAETAVVYGEDETISAIRPRMRPGERLVAHGERASLALVGGAALEDERAARDAARGAARDVSLAEGRGCLSPQAVYVEPGRAVPPRRFAEFLTEEMAAAARALPRGRPLSVGEAAAVRRARALVEFSGGEGGEVLAPSLEGPGALAWTVLFENSPVFRASPGARTVRVQPLPAAEALAAALGAWAGRIAGLGAAGFSPEAVAAYRRALGLAPRQVLPLGAMQAPPLRWRSDGRTPLSGILRPA